LDILAQPRVSPLHLAYPIVLKRSSNPRETHKLTAHLQSEMVDGTQSCPRWFGRGRSAPPPKQIIEMEAVATQLATHLQLPQLYLRLRNAVEDVC